mmetsp:Transcript_23417/g.54191  ORF Transcript_23417/g.54191 Transcript_23417/m.54191 type:complete len:206 (-) Transcript_23417:1085-1702(-)
MTHSVRSGRRPSSKQRRSALGGLLCSSCTRLSRPARAPISRYAMRRTGWPCRKRTGASRKGQVQESSICWATRLCTSPSTTPRRTASGRRSDFRLRRSGRWPHGGRTSARASRASPTRGAMRRQAMTPRGASTCGRAVSRTQTRPSMVTRASRRRMPSSPTSRASTTCSATCGSGPLRTSPSRRGSACCAVAPTSTLPTAPSTTW